MYAQCYVYSRGNEQEVYKMCNRDGSRDVRKEVESVVRMPREEIIGMDQ